MSGEVDLDTFRLKEPGILAVEVTQPLRGTRRYPRKTRPKGEEFLRGPIPMWWLQQAAQLPGPTVELGIVLWRMAFLRNDMAVQLTSTGLQEMNVDRSAKLRALMNMEKAGLIKVERKHGKNPVVTIVDERGPELAELSEPVRVEPKIVRVKKPRQAVTKKISPKTGRPVQLALPGMPRCVSR
jgi:hypothetical protein